MKHFIFILFFALLLSGCNQVEVVKNNNYWFLNDTEFSGDYRSMSIDNNGNFYEYDGNIIVHVEWDDKSNSGLDVMYVFDTTSNTEFYYEITVFGYEDVVNSSGNTILVRNILLRDLNTNQEIIGRYSIWDGYVILEMFFANDTVQFLLVNTPLLEENQTT